MQGRKERTVEKGRPTDCLTAPMSARRTIRVQNRGYRRGGKNLVTALMLRCIHLSKYSCCWLTIILLSSLCQAMPTAEADDGLELEEEGGERERDWTLMMMTAVVVWRDLERNA